MFRKRPSMVKYPFLPEQAVKAIAMMVMKK